MITVTIKSPNQGGSKTRLARLFQAAIAGDSKMNGKAVIYEEGQYSSKKERIIAFNKAAEELNRIDGINVLIRVKRVK